MPDETRSKSYDKYTKALLHFDNIQEDLFKDEISPNRWQPVGISWNRVVSQGSIIISESILGKGNQIHLSLNQYFNSTYPIILGGQDFTIDGYCRYKVGVNPYSYSVAAYAPIFSLFTKDEEDIKYNRPDPEAIELKGRFTYAEFFEYQDNKVRNNNIIHSLDAGTNEDGTLIGSSNNIFHFAVVYKHLEKTMTVYLNGKQCRVYKNTNIPRHAFNHAYVGRDMFGNTCDDAEIDEFRICDGIAIYNGDFIIPSAEKLLYTDQDKDQTKTWFDFDDPEDDNRIHCPINMDDDNKYKHPVLFDRTLYLDGNHQFLELINGINLGSEDFTIESYIWVDYDNIIDSSKRLTVFEMNHGGCTDPDTYLRFVIIRNTLQLEQNNFIPGAPKILMTYEYPEDFDTNSLFHWAVVYSKSTDSLKFFFNGNLILSREAKNVTGIDYQQFLIGTNLNTYNTLYSYYDCFIGRIDEFRISNTARYGGPFNPPGPFEPGDEPKQEEAEEYTYFFDTKRSVLRELWTINWYRGNPATKRIVQVDDIRYYPIEFIPGDTFYFDLKRDVRKDLRLINNEDFRLKNPIRFAVYDIGNFDTERIITDPDDAWIIAVGFRY